jgi:Phage head-tail joining protein
MATGALRPIGARARHRVQVYAAGPVVPDGDGGFTPSPQDRGEWNVEIRAATTADLERFASGTIIAQASHVLIGRFHPDVTAESVIVRHDYGTGVDHTYRVAGVRNVQELGVETIAIVEEVL